MDPDLLLTAGVALLALTIPAIASALGDGRAPRLASLVVLIGGTLIVLAVEEKPGGYRFDQIPGVMVATTGRLVR